MIGYKQATQELKMSECELVDIKALLELIVKALVDHSDDVHIELAHGRQSTVIELRVHADDVGKVIGKKGIHAHAIRTIIHAVGGKNQRRYVLEIIE